MGIVFKSGLHYFNEKGNYKILRISGNELLVSYDYGAVDTLNLSDQRFTMIKMLATGYRPKVQNPQFDAYTIATTLKLIEKYGIHSLYYMACLSHSGSIIARGIYCRNEATKMGLIKYDFSDRAVQDRRKNRHGITLHEHVPLYFTFDTPMRQVLLFGSSTSPRKIKAEDLVFVELDAKRILLLENVCIADGNAASDRTICSHCVNSALERIDWNAMRNHGFNDCEKRQAEVLVPSHVPAEFIKSCIVQSQLSKDRLQTEIRNITHRLGYTLSKSGIPIQIKEQLYRYY